MKIHHLNHCVGQTWLHFKCRWQIHLFGILILFLIFHCVLFCGSFVDINIWVWFFECHIQNISTRKQNKQKTKKKSKRVWCDRAINGIGLIIIRDNRTHFLIEMRGNVSHSKMNSNFFVFHLNIHRWCIMAENQQVFGSEKK